MRKSIFILFLALVLCCSCEALFNSNKPSLEGKWGMVSGVIEINGDLQQLSNVGAYYKTMEFKEDGTFTEEYMNMVATGTYTVQNGSSIKYSYKSIPTNKPVFMAIHQSGSWTYYFWNENSLTLYDFSSVNHEVSMTFERTE